MFATMILAAALSATNATAVTSAPAVSTVAAVPAVSTNMPPRIVTTWNQAQRELRRTAAQEADGALDAAAAARRRAAIARAFARVCREKNLPEAEIARWRDKLMSR